MAPASTATHHVFVSVPKREGFKGLFAIGRFFEDGKTGPHAVTADELAKLKANARLAVEPASPEEIEAGGSLDAARRALAPQTSASGLPEDEQAILDSFRSAKAQRVGVTLVRIAELDQAHSRAAELEAEVKNVRAHLSKDLEAAKARAAELEAEVKKAVARVAELEQQVKALESSKKK